MCLQARSEQRERERAQTKCLMTESDDNNHVRYSQDVFIYMFISFSLLELND